MEEDYFRPETAKANADKQKGFPAPEPGIPFIATLQITVIYASYSFSRFFTVG